MPSHSEWIDHEAKLWNQAERWEKEDRYMPEPLSLDEQIARQCAAAAELERNKEITAVQDEISDLRRAYYDYHWRGGLRGELGQKAKELEQQALAKLKELTLKQLELSE